jgi:hypothetical protein
MRRLVVIVALGGILVGCGASTKTEVLRSTDPEASNLYFYIHGPSRGVSMLARLFGTRLSSHTSLVVTPHVHGQKDCSFTRRITGDAAIPPLRRLAGEKLTVAIYGSGSHASSLCRHLEHGLTGSS